MDPLTPSGFDRLCNPTAYRRWREATATQQPIRYCGCPANEPHESHCDSWSRWDPTT